jgi:hypothetical protein
MSQRGGTELAQVSRDIFKRDIWDAKSKFQKTNLALKCLHKLLGSNFSENKNGTSYREGVK